MPRTKFGVCLPNFGLHASAEAVLSVAKAAEEMGLESVWTTDHVLVPNVHADPYGTVLDPLATLAFVGAQTHRVKLGTSILVVPLRNPILVAKEAASIDHLSNGRLILGAGVGWLEKEFSYLRADYKRRGAYFKESIRVMRVLWTEKSPELHGQFFDFSGATFQPKPAQPGGPPIFIGGNSKVAVRRAAKIGDGWHPVGVSVESLRSGAEYIREHAGGRRCAISMRIRVDTTGKAKPYAGATGERREAISGEPRQVVEMIQRYEGAGLEHLVCYFGDKPEGILAQMREFSRHVIPSFS